jgi:hypothetical protein
MNKKKIILLFLSLMLPIVVFIFLKSFGKNEFAVQPLFQDSVQVPKDCANLKYTAPYSISDSLLFKLYRSVGDSLTLFVFDDTLSSHRKENSIQMERIITESSFNQMRYITNSATLMNNAIMPKAVVVELSNNEFLALRNCIFLLKPGDNSVLIDWGGRIRGQYDLTNLDDADRLLMEIQIILKQY